jgi:hypothetical protein
LKHRRRFDILSWPRNINPRVSIGWRNKEPEAFSLVRDGLLLQLCPVVAPEIKICYKINVFETQIRAVFYINLTSWKDLNAHTDCKKNLLMKSTLKNSSF